MSSAVATKAVGALTTIGAVSLVSSYVYSQLHQESNKLDRAFSSYFTPESEAARRKVFANASEDPRTNVLNFLSWK